MIYAPSKKTEAKEPYFIVWCDPSGRNDGSTSDNGELQGETISVEPSPSLTPSTSTSDSPSPSPSIGYDENGVHWDVPVGIEVVSTTTEAVVIHGVSYPENTVCTIWLYGGTDGTDYQLTCHVKLTDGRELNETIVVPVRE